MGNVSVKEAGKHYPDSTSIFSEKKDKSRAQAHENGVWHPTTNTLNISSNVVVRSKKTAVNSDEDKKASEHLQENFLQVSFQRKGQGQRTRPPAPFPTTFLGQGSEQNRHKTGAIFPAGRFPRNGPFPPRVTQFHVRGSQCE